VRVRILRTGAIEAFIKNGKALTEPQAARFYVAVTRAHQSVAIVMSDAGRSLYPVVWGHGTDSAISDIVGD